MATLWPAWWSWELELSAHLLERMLSRGFNEVDLRTMLEHAKCLVEDVEPGRWIVETDHLGRTWEVIVEPDDGSQRVIVVTAHEAG